MSTLAEIRANVQSNLPTGYHAAQLTTTKIDGFINAAMREVCRRHNFAWMKKDATQSTVDSQQRYGLPDGTTLDGSGNAIWAWKTGIDAELVDYQGYRIPLTRRYKTDIEADPSHADTAEDGIPRDWCEEQDDLWLYPIPDHAENNNTAFSISMEYWGYPPVLSATNTRNKLTDGWPEVLECWATARCYRHGGDYDQAAYWNGEFEKQLAVMIVEDVARQDGGIEQGLTPAASAQLSGGASAGRIYTTGGYVDGT